MTPEGCFELLRAAFPGEIDNLVLDGPHPHAVVKPQRWREVALFLRDDPHLRIDWLRCISALDHLEDKRFTLVYDLHATRRSLHAGGMWSVGAELAIKICIPRDDPRIASVADVWPAANWHEREAYDLFGIIFEGHPDLRRILCPDDWVGHPLRKDYEFPMQYQGIPGTTEYAQTRPQH